MKSASNIIQTASRSGRTALSERQAKQILSCFGLSVPNSVIISYDQTISEDDLKGLKPPLVLKIMSDAILHKTEVGGVRLGLQDAEDVNEAIADMRRGIKLAEPQAASWLVEELAPAGVEIVVGGVVDPCFGPTVMFGLGGIFVELLEDVAFRICPITPHDARQMIGELKGVKLLDGWRGSTPVPRSTLEDVLLAVGGEGGLMMTLCDEIAELDINPLIVTGSQAVAVDARIILKDGL